MGGTEANLRSFYIKKRRLMEQKMEGDLESREAFVFSVSYYSCIFMGIIF